MRLRPAFLLITALASAWAKAPLKVTLEAAAYLAGPGQEPPAGKPPFEPRIQAQVSIQGLRPGAVPAFRLWRMPEAAAKGLRPGRPVRKGLPGLLRVEGASDLLRPGTYRILAPAGTGWTPGECLVVEVFLKGRWAGRGTAPLLETGLLRTERPGREEMRP